MSAPKPHIAVRYSVATHGSHTPRRIVIHDTECGDLPDVGEITGVAKFWARQGQGLGSQFMIDGDGNIGQGCASTLITYHVADHNTGSIGIELIGFARFSRARWISRRRQMVKLAKLLAYLSAKYGIPLNHSTDHGVCMHRDFTDGTHTDPGVGFPFRHVLREARKRKRATA